MITPPPMDPERWRLVARLVRGARERSAADRKFFLDEACAADAVLRAEVEGLLEQESSADAFFVRGAAGVFGESVANDDASTADLPSGTRLGSYQIERPIGRGGMGAVFLAFDTVLRRPAAVKIVDDDRHDGASLKALLREARSVSTLSHPNICTVYEVGEAQGRAYIAMEYVDGRPFSDVLKNGPLSVSEVLRLGLEISDALSHAHARGVIHRDLKVANVMLTDAGHAKIVDFGLARRLDAQSAEATTTTASSWAGVVRGTPYAMAPEQVRGAATDERSDIWALGVLLYQMTTATKPFHGPTVVELFSSILRDEPDALTTAVPPPLRDVILRCLAKDPRRRYQHASEAQAALTAIASALQLGLVSGTDPAIPVSRAIVEERRTIRRRAVLAAIVLMGASLVAVWAMWPSRQTSRAIAILPLVNLSDGSQEALVDGMTDGIINSLGRVAAVKVIARTSVMRFKGAQKSVAEIAAALGVDTVVEGTATLSAVDGAERLRVTINLIDSRSQTVIWGDILERDLSGVLALQGDIARRIAEHLNAGVTVDERRLLDAQQRVNPEAYKLYVLGRQAWNLRTAAGLGSAVRYFEQAITLAPDYAQAHAGLADAYVLLTGDFGALPRDQGSALAVASATRALELDPTLAEAHTSLAFAHFFLMWEFDVAGREFVRALEFNPSYATAHQWYGNYLSDMGREEEGLAHMRQALVLDPLSPIISRDVAWPLFFSGRYDDAVRQLNDTLARHAEYAPAERLLARTYAQMNNHTEAIRRFEALRVRDGSARAICELAWAYAKAGRRAEAERTLAEARSKRTDKLYPYDLALVFVALDQPDEALRELRRALDERDPTMVNLRHDPRLAPLRSDPRYATLLALMHFPK